ncbi:Os02g0657925 [Oryza sativa Japonica Group]|uniref:Os02g0657925 protein n=1 Tax=Oryza sativa subsp. japonica TaxID=39947 RepID=A0A0P0VMK8_ORYSJ|nr:Os02g0657925 [Oryza sativa Japonica Group]
MRLAPIRPPSIGCASRAKPASISAACAKPASISTARASRAEPASAAIGCASLRQADLRPLHPTMPRRPDATVSHALGKPSEAAMPLMTATVTTTAAAAVEHSATSPSPSSPRT